MKSPPLTALLVEDEPLCRADFRQILKSFPDVRLLGEAENLEGARNFLGTRDVDLLFLDLSLGRENGLDLVETLAPGPLVIALTAHPQHAVRGFSLDLVDYILKPVEIDRLHSALEKARHRKAAAPLAPGRVTFLAEMEGKKVLLELRELLWVESMGNYIVLHTTRGRAIQRATLKQMRNIISPDLFLETARGCMVARTQIASWHRDSQGHLVLMLFSGSSLRVARSRTSAILKILQAG